MKKLIKLVVVVVVVGVFTFSSNPVITKVRNFSVEKGKVLYEKAVNKSVEIAEINGKDGLKESIEKIAK